MYLIVSVQIRLFMQGSVALSVLFVKTVLV
jgi:hypothetical protein